MADIRNALAELAKKIDADRKIFEAFKDDLGDQPNDVGGMVNSDLVKASRILAELAKVHWHEGYIWAKNEYQKTASFHDCYMAVMQCRAIAEEGATNDER